MRTVGSIGIDVQPDASGFNNKLKNDLRKAEEKNQVEIPVKPNTTGMAQKVREARDQIQERIDGGKIAIKIPVTPDDRTSIREIRSNVNRMNDTIRSQGIELKIPLGLDAKKLATDLKVALEDAQKKLSNTLKLKIEIELDTQTVKEDWDHLKRELNGDKVDLKADLDRQNTVKAQLALLTRNRNVNLVVRITKRSLAVATAALTALSGFNLLKNAALGLESFITNLDTAAIGAAKLGTGLITLASGALAMTSSVVGLAGGLGQLGGFALTAPAALIGVAAAFTAVKMAFSGFTMAVSPEAAGDFKKMQQWLELLPPEAQKAAIALRGLYKDIQVPVQEAFWSRMSGSIETFTTKVVPELKAGMIEVGRSMGGFTSQIFAGLSGAGVGVIESLFVNISGAIDQAAQGIRPLINGFLQLATEGANHLPDVGRNFRDMADQFDSWVRRSLAAGKVTEWIANAAEAGHDLGRVIIAVVGQFKALGEIARNSGAGNLDTFANKLEDIRATMESQPFREGLGNLFKGAHEAAQSMKAGLQDVGRALGTIAPTLRDIMSISGDTVGSIFTGIASAIQQPAFRDGLTGFFRGIRDGIKGVLTYLPNITNGFGHLSDLMGTIVANLLPVIGQGFAGVADVFGQLAPALKGLVPILGEFAGSSLAVFLDFLNLLATPMRIVLEFFNSLPELVQTAALSLLLLMKLVKGGGGLGFGKSVTGPITQGLRDVPAAANAARSSLSRPLLGPGFASASAFAPFMTSLRGIPAAASPVMRDLTRNFNDAMKTFPGVAATAATGVVRQFTPVATGVGSQFRRMQDDVRRSMAGLPADVRASLGQVVPPVQGITGRINQAFQGMVSSVKSGMKGLFSFIGGGWGAAFIAAFAIITTAKGHSRDLEEINKGVSKSYQDIAKAAGDAGEAIGGAAAQKAALDRLNEVGSKQAQTAGLFGWVGENKNLESLLKESGLGDQAFADLMSGKGNASADAYIKGLAHTLQQQKDGMALDLNSDSPGGVFPDWMMQALPGDDFTNLQGSIDILNGMTESADKARGAFDKLWSTDVNRAQLIPAVLGHIRDAAADGKVTIDNINGIHTAISGLKLDGADKVGQFSNALGQVMGGDFLHMAQNADIAAKSIEKFKAAGSKGDMFQALTQGFTRANRPIGEIRKGLSAFGLSMDEIDHQIKFVWGSGLDTMGRQLTVLGEPIPKLTENSTGIREFSLALGAAANIDPDILQKVFSLGGVNLGKLATDLPAAGVGLEQIKTALVAAGVKGPELGQMLAQAAQEAGKLVAKTGTSVPTLMAFSAGLDAIRDSADDAATSSGKVFQLLDQLNGGKLETGDIVAAFADARRAIEQWGQAAEGETSKFATLKEVMQDDGSFNANVKGYSEVSQGLVELSSTGIAAATRAFEDSIKSGKDSLQARADSAKAIEPIIATLKSVADQAGLSETEYQGMLAAFHLTPEEIEISAIMQTEGALGDLAELQREMSVASAGAVIPMTMTNEAANDVKQLGIDFVEISKGKYEVKLSADPEIAKKQVADLQTFVLTQPVSNLPVELDPTIGKMPVLADIIVPMIPDVNQFETGLQVLDGMGVEITVAGDINPAKEGIQALNYMGAEITVTGDINPVLDGVQIIDNMGVEITVGGDTNPAKAGIQVLNNEAVEITISGDINPAMRGVQFIDAQGVEITVGADINPAKAGVQIIDSMGVQITVGADVSSARSAIDRLNGRSVSINVKAVVGGLRGLGITEATGGILNFTKSSAFKALVGLQNMQIKAFANGGEHHVAQIAPAGAMRLWAEPETGGEAYIPLSPAKRGRSLQILSQVATQFGYTLAKIGQKALAYENGGNTTGSVTNTGASVIVNQYNPVVQKDSVMVTRAAQLLAARGTI